MSRKLPLFRIDNSGSSRATPLWGLRQFCIIDFIVVQQFAQYPCHRFVLKAAFFGKTNIMIRKEAQYLGRSIGLGVSFDMAVLIDLYDCNLIID